MNSPAVISPLPRLDLIPRNQFSPQAGEAFIAYLQTSAATAAAYTIGVKKFIAWLALQDLETAMRPTRQTLIAYRQYLIAQYKPSTVNLYITALHLLFAWLAQEGLYADIAAHIKGVKLSRSHKRDNLSADGIRAIFAGITGTDAIAQRDRAIIALMATTGIRGVEVVRADVADLRHLGDHLVLFIQGKGRTEKSDFVKIPGAVETIMREYLATRGHIGANSPLFASVSNNSTGGRLTRKSISRIIKGRFTAAGYNSPTLTAHSLRHTTATLALQAGEPLEKVQGLLRHSNINTTMIYTHTLDRMNSTAENTVAAAIF